MWANAGEALHPTLRRQLSRLGIEIGGEPPSAEVLEQLLARVDRSYRAAEELRYTLERSMEVSSAEMRKLYDELAAASERLVQSEQSKLESVISALDHGVIAVDTDGAILFSNRTADTLLGGRPESIFELMDRFHPRDANGDPIDVGALVQRSYRGEHVLELPCRLVRRDGTEIEVLGSLSPIYEEGSVVGGVLTFHDRTEHNETLDQLASALQEARTAVEVKASFLANMSHEIRTPMNGVIGMIELLSGTDLTSEQAQFAQIAKTSGEALLTIINEILDFSKLEAGKVELERSDFDPAGVAEDVAGLLTPKASTNGVVMNVLVGPGVPRRAEGDGGRIRQVLMNLVGNAVKFTDQGSVSVRVERANRGARSDRNVIDLSYKVTDTGCGIPADRLGDMFTPFSQLDASTTRTHGGTGLGLAICHELVRLMGGEMQVESELGIGSTFSFSLPVWLGVEEMAEEAAVRPLPEDLVILVVDDQETNRRITREYVQRIGGKVVEASGGEEALIRIRTAAELGKRFDMVVTDSQMGAVGGLELARAIRNEPSVASTPIVVLSSVSHTGDDRDELAELADSVLMKPLRQTSFHDALADVWWRRDGETPDGSETGDAAGADPSDASAARASSEVRILVVEDNATNQIVIRAFLDRLGLTARLAENGEEAVRAVSEESFDVVLMDCQMPVMDGYEATRAIRRLDGPAATVPIVAMTANALKGDREKCLDAGMDDHLAKPLDIATLRDALERHVPGSVSGDAPADPSVGASA